ncbi:MAG: hypothetical protein PHY51_03110, partial [Candidatus Gracilibacteria bacterium]|nr:hypothetical protein [Candidatus Gracilibacteria bacterium]
EFIKFSGNNFAFIYEDKLKQHININGKDFGPLYLIDQDNSFFSLNGNNIGVIYKKEKEMYIYDYYININGIEYGPYSMKDRIEFKNIDINTKGIFSLKFNLNNNEYIDIYSYK